MHRLLAALLLPALAMAQDTPRPNLVIVLADDLGWADVGFHGQLFYETPHIDRLARDGLVLDRFYPGGPNCSPSRACIASGCYTPRHAVYQPGGTGKGDVTKMRFKVPTAGQGEDFDTLLSRRDLLPSEFVTFGEILRDAGYATARIGKWHLGDDPQGFDLATNDGVRPFPAHRGDHYGDPDVHETMVARALEFLDANREGPFVLYLSMWEVHTPLVAREAIVAKYQRKLADFDDDSFAWKPRYAAEVEVVDQAVGAVRGKLEELGIAERTLLLFTSDNGGLPGPTRNTPLRAGKGSLFEGGIRVPAVAWWPGHIAPGRRSDTAVHGVDLLPTFCELAGANLPAGQPADGSSVVPLLTSDAELPERALFWHYPLYLSGGVANRPWPVFGTDDPYWRAVPASAIARGPWKLIHSFEHDRDLLFDVVSDPSESQDLAEREVERTKALRAELFAWLEATGAPIPNGANPEFAKQGR